MASFKTNYAGLRKPQKKSDFLPNSKESPMSNNDQQDSYSMINPSSFESKTNSIKKPKADFLDLYKGNFNSGNLDYVNLLIKNQTSSNQKTQGSHKRKTHSRTKSTFVESTQPPIHEKPASPAKHSSKEIISPVSFVEENDKAPPPSMRPDDDDGFQRIEIEKIERDVNKSFGRKEEEFYGGNDTHRNLNNTPTGEEGKKYDKFFQDGIVRRSMSLEDLRIEKKVFSRNHNNHNKSTMHHHPEEMRSELIEKNYDESMYTALKNPHSSPKGDFLTNLDYYIHYFQKSDNMSYRNMKAGQYFRNVGKSHRSIQKELETSNHELRSMKLQMEKMKWKMEAQATENKMLTKELKTLNSREEETQQLLHKLQEQVFTYKQKSQNYKIKCLQIQDVLEQERLEHENNLQALKQVLANIGLALDKKSSPYKNRERTKQFTGGLDKLLFKKDRERTVKSNFRNHRQQNNNNDTVDAYASIYEGRNSRKSKENRDTAKRQSSALLSHKLSISSTGEDVEESESNQFSNSFDYENTYEGQDSRMHDLYQDPYQERVKDQQIRFLQGKLAELMSSGEETPFLGQTAGLKSTTKSSRGNKSHNKKQASGMEVPSYYILRERQGSIPKQSNLISKLEHQEKMSKIKMKNYQETPSMNEASENSFSLHHSD